MKVSPLRIVLVGLAFGILAASLIGNVRARDLGQWEASSPAIREWYQGLMQPDVPAMSCCGEADSYFADVMHFRDGKVFAEITDERPDEPLRRPHVESGTLIEVPQHKLKWDRGNPTGHGVLFISKAPFFHVFCYVQPGGA